MITIKVLFLGPSREIAGGDCVDVDVANDLTVGGLRAVLSERNQALARALQRMRFAVNAEFADDEAVLRHGDEVAVIPPVSGG